MQNKRISDLIHLEVMFEIAIIYCNVWNSLQFLLLQFDLDHSIK